jgi:hypothetical protein
MIICSEPGNIMQDPKGYRILQDPWKDGKTSSWDPGETEHTYSFKFS